MKNWKWLQSKWLAIAWLILISILFLLPGSAFPKEDWFDKIYFDKWVHFGLFVILLILWCAAFDLVTTKSKLLIMAGSFIYALAIEIIQKEWVPNRSFDIYDIAAGVVGAAAGILFWTKLEGYIKK